MARDREPGKDRSDESGEGQESYKGRSNVQKPGTGWSGENDKNVLKQSGEDRDDRMTDEERKKGF